MSTQVLPALQGLGFGITREPMWKTIIPEAISGKESRIGLWSYPRWQWTLKYNFLRQGTFQNGANTEFSNFAGLFNILQGSFDSFLYLDPDDNTAMGQVLGDGDGTTVAFPLVRAFGGFVEPIYAPNVVSAVYINGVLQSSSTYTVTYWGASVPGVITFNTPPANTLPVSADFTFYFPVRWSTDTMPFIKDLSTVWKLNAAKFISIK